MLFETRLNVFDIRSGYRNSESVWLFAEWLEDPDLSWARGMVESLDPRQLEEIDPPRPLSWPDYAEQRLFQYLSRHFRPVIWRNPQLGLFSRSGQAREEFLEECRDALRERRWGQLGQVHQMYLHRFIELETRAVDRVREDELDEQWRRRRLVTIEKVFSSIREDFSTLFLRDDPLPAEPHSLVWQVEFDVDLQERIDQLKAELVHRYNEVVEEFEERAGQIEPYEVTVNYRQLELETRGFLW